MVKLTPRMKDWIEGLGCHICTASTKGMPTVTISRYAKVISDDEVAFALAKDEYAIIKPDLDENPWVAFSVSHLGVVKAPYQFKGVASIITSGPLYDQIAAEAKNLGIETSVVLLVKVREIYCTRPGPQAGWRLDTRPYEENLKLDEKWSPPKPPPRPQ